MEIRLCFNYEENIFNLFNKLHEIKTSHLTACGCWKELTQNLP
jgi:hypothetical protein